jgi:arylsulfatase
MLVTDGGRFGGYGLYLLKGKPVFLYNLLALERFRWEGKDALAPGKHTIVFDFKYDGPGMAKGGTGVLSVDGKQVDSKRIPHTIPALLTTRTTSYRSRFTGKLGKLKIKLIPPPAEEERLLQQKGPAG